MTVSTSIGEARRAAMVAHLGGEGNYAKFGAILEAQHAFAQATKAPLGCSVSGWYDIKKRSCEALADQAEEAYRAARP
jgi:hypothetical protein